MKITVLEVIGNRVKLGIEADSTIGIHREEVYRRIWERDEEPDFLHEPMAVG